MPELRLDQSHISQAFNLTKSEKELDFFDANLYYDSPLFIDPFLLKTSQIAEENALFERFGKFFKFAYRKSVDAKSETDINKLKKFLNFKEPSEINLGYTVGSNKGSGLGGVFASAILAFFIKSSAYSVIMDDSLYPDGKFNPDILTVLTDGVGPDGISDLSACLIMDYLIKYTQNQCEQLSIPRTSLPINQAFDFEEMEWKSAYYQLPENPLRPGEAIIFVPKRLLRMGLDMSPERARSKIVGILRTDDNLKERFSGLLNKSLFAIRTSDIQDVVIAENSIIGKYLRAIEKEGISSYDFLADILNILAIKKYQDQFKEVNESAPVENCEDLLVATQELLDEFQKELSQRDGWKDNWHKNGRGTLQPNDERSFGRQFRGMGFGYFRRLPEVTFIPEAGSGNGLVDFLIVYRDCRITVEVKRLSNATATGKPPLPAYLHGITRQLPDYTILHSAKYAFYLTGQHFATHSGRIKEISDAIPSSEKMIRGSISNFQKLSHVNVQLMGRPTASKL